MKNKKWSSLRHRIVLRILRMIIYPTYYFKYHFSYKKLDKEARKRNYLILFNHQTVLDQFLVPASFTNHIYFVMSDDFDAIPFVSKLLRFLVHPIPFKKSSSDMMAVKNMMKVAREGESVAISPEGNRTYRGITEYMNPAIVKLVKMLRLPVAFVHIHGFYAYPRFAKKNRKAKIDVKIHKICEYDELKGLDEDSLYKFICDNLYVNDYDEENIQKVKSNNRAMYLERLIYHCPTCGITHLKSHNNTITCTKCNKEYYLDEHYNFPNGPFKNILDWDNYQRKMIIDTPLSSYDNDYIITNDVINFHQVIPHKKKQLINKNITLSLYNNHLEISNQNDKYLFNFEDIISTGCFGSNKMNIILDGITYQIKGDKRFNPVKYVYHIYKYKNETGKIDNNYLGI